MSKLKKQLQIVIINRLFNASGAIPNIVNSLATHMSNEGANIQIYASDVSEKESTEHLKFNRLPIYKGSFARKFDLNGWLFAKCVYLALRKSHRRKKVDVVHVHDSTAFYGAWLFGLRARVPVIFTYHAWIHQPEKKYMYPRDLHAVYRLNVRLIQRLADRVCCVSEEIHEGLRDRYGTPDNKIRIIHNLIDMNKFNNKNKVDMNTPPKRLLFIGRLTKSKGLPYLINAMQKVSSALPDVKLELVGDGNRNDIIKLASKAGVLDSITITGSVPHAEITEVYNRSDVLVFPSLAEGHAKTPIEALACGLPVVGTKIGGVVETVQHEINGLLVPPKDVKALAGALIRLLTDNDLFYRLRMKARESVMKFSIEGISGQYLSLYSSVADHEKK